MDKIKKFLRQFQLSAKRKFFTRERTVFLVIAGASLYFIGFSVTSMSRNWELEQTLNEKNRARMLLNLEVETLSLENQYYSSAEYQELSARARQNKIAQGETMIYLPKNSEVAKTKHANENTTIDPETEEDPSNFSQWIAFLFGL